MPTNVTIVIKDGIVAEAYSDGEKVAVTIIDRDYEEFEGRAEGEVIPVGQKPVQVLINPY